MDAGLFLLESLGVTDYQLDVVSKLRSVEGLEGLALHEDTRFLILKGVETGFSAIALEGYLPEELYTVDKVRELLEGVNLHYSRLGDYSHQGESNRRGTPLIHFTFLEDEDAEDDKTNKVELYVRKKRI